MVDNRPNSPRGAPASPGRERRAHERVWVADRVRATIFLDTDADAAVGNDVNRRVVREGVTRDLSPAGACILLEAETIGLAPERLVGQKVKIRLKLPEHRRQPDVGALAAIVWAKEESGNLALGVRFEEITALDQRILEQHCLRDGDAQGLLFQLWRGKCEDRTNSGERTGEVRSLPHPDRPILIAVGGGKGGVGKSVLSVLMGQWMALLEKRVLIVDLDLSGANVHTLLGFRDHPCSVGDLLKRRADSLDEIALPTSTPKLRIVCGDSEDLALANPHYAQKLKIMAKLRSVNADIVIMDLGAGASFDVLDFFLSADLKLVVTTADPTSVHNAYGFLRNAVFRRLIRLTRQMGEVNDTIRKAMDPRDPENLSRLDNLLEAISRIAGDSAVERIQQAMSRVQPAVVVNLVRDERDLIVAGAIREVARKHLLTTVEELGGVPYDRQLRRMVAAMQPLTNLRDGNAFESTYHLSATLLQRAAARLQSARTHDSNGIDSASLAC